MDITRYKMKNNLRISSLKFTLRICWKPEVLLSLFDNKVACNVIASLPMLL